MVLTGSCFPSLFRWHSVCPLVSSRVSRTCLVAATVTALVLSIGSVGIWYTAYYDILLYLYRLRGIPLSVGPVLEGPLRDRTAIHSDIGMWFVTYGDAPRYDAATARVSKQAARTGWFDHIEVFTQHNLSRAFRDEFADILAMERGGGYWLWRFYVLQDVMSRFRENVRFFSVSFLKSAEQDGERRHFDLRRCRLPDQPPRSSPVP